jgi:hypothetical protein
MAGGYVLYSQVNQPARPPRRGNGGNRGGISQALNRQLGGGGNPSVVPIARELRIFANTSTVVEGYVVGVRQVMLGGIDRSLFEPNSGPPPPFSNVVLHIQIAKPAVSEIVGCRVNSESFEGIDSTGKKLTNVGLSPELATPLPIPGGLVQVVRLAISSPEATSLKELNGKLLIDGPGKTRHEFPIHLENIPLPSAPRIFADLKPFSSTAQTNSPSANSFQPLLGESAKSLMQSAVKPTSGLPLPRLVMATGVPANVPLPTVGSSSWFTFTLHEITPFGYKVTLATGASNWTGSVWPGEPFVVALPGSAEKCEVILWPSWRLTARPETMPPFPAPRGRPGGAISWRVIVGDRPFGAGTLALNVSKQEAAGWSAPVVVTSFIGYDGLVTMRGMAPGRYRIERLPESLVADALVEGKAISLPDYLRERFNSSNGVWENKSVEVDVRAGTRIDASPFVLPVIPASGNSVTSLDKLSNTAPVKSR